ncbi:MAG: prephenate dehydrogenase [Eubacteriales bacterium]
MDNLSDKNITIVGLGLIGGSIAKGISKNIKAKNLWAVDVDQKTLDTAEKEKIIEKGFTNPKYPLQNSDLVILCTYPDTTLEFIEKNKKYFKKNSIITDTTGIKEVIIDKIKNMVDKNIIFIGGHPMAGKEVSGYQHSSVNIFKNSEYILTPTNDTDENSLNLLTKLIKNIGFNKVTFMTPEIHDRKIALTSQLPHLIACALMNNKGLEKDLSGIGGSFKDMTRVANINSNLWCELISVNKNNLLKEIDVFIEDINEIYDTIKNSDKKELKKIFEESSLRRKGIDDEKSNC